MWAELGIAPCDDPKIIRRAYAARLKQLDQDRDPEAFTRLRRALEWALAKAKVPEPTAGKREQTGPSRDTAPPDDAARMEDVDPGQAPQATDVVARPAAAEPLPGRAREPSAAPRPDDDAAREQALLVALDRAMQRRDAAEATKLYYRAAATGALSLRAAEDALERLFALALEPAALDRGRFREIAKNFGWDNPPRSRAPPSEIRQRVLARLAGEDWYDSLLASAIRRAGNSQKQLKVARLMLKRIRHRSLFWVDHATLTARIAEYRTHQEWLQDRIDPAWVATLEQRLRRRDVVGSLFFSFFIAALLIQGVHVFVVELSEGRLSAGYVIIGPAFAGFLIWILKLLLTNAWRKLRGP